MSSFDSKYNRSEKGKARYARHRDAHRERSFYPHPCARKGCERPAQMFESGRFDAYCSLHKNMSATLYHARRQVEITNQGMEDL